MCRLLAYSGPTICAADLLLRPSRSIVRQSYDAKERANGPLRKEAYEHGQINADGFGMAFYDFENEKEGELKPCVFTEVGPAWNSKNLRRLSEKVRAKLFFAHIRAAGPGLGAVCDCKTHPFTYGRYSFMHNGEIAGFSVVRRRLLEKLKKDESFNLALLFGATDTAVAFALFIDLLNSPNENLSSIELLETLKITIKIICEACEEAKVEGSCKLNFVVTNGDTIIATRYAFDLNRKITPPSLYYSSGSSFGPTTRYEGEEDFAANLDPALAPPKSMEYRIFHSERRCLMTIITSEPITDIRSDWIPVPENHVVVVQRTTGEVLCSPFYHRFEPYPGARLAVANMFTCLESLNDRPEQIQLTRTKSSLKRLVDNASSSPKLSDHVESLFTPKRSLLRMLSSSLIQSEEMDNIMFHGAEKFKELQFPFHVLSDSGQQYVSAFAKYKDILYSADAGAFSGKVCAYSLSTFELISSRNSWGILSLACLEEKAILFGSRSDGKILMWDISRGGRLDTAAKRICLPSLGHVLSMCLTSDRIIIGSQDGNIRSILIEDVSKETECAQDCPFTDISLSNESNDLAVEQFRNCSSSCKNKTTVFNSRSHRGFVYAVTIYDGLLYSGASCGSIKVWELSTNVCIKTLVSHNGSVMDLRVFTEEKVVASCSLDGTIKFWDISNDCQYMKTLEAPIMDPLCCLASFEDAICAGSVSGAVWIWGRFSMHDAPQVKLSVSGSPINSLAPLKDHRLAVGAGSGRITVWEIPALQKSSTASSKLRPLVNNEAMMSALTKFISIKSISSEEIYKKDCTEAAQFVLKIMKTLGLQTRYFETRNDGTPCVLGKLEATKQSVEKKNSCIFCYGHYDVFPVNEEDWDSNPFELIGKEGYLFGRGISDNKGPIIAMLYAAAKVALENELGHDIVFCFDGEDETSLRLSERNLIKTLQTHREFIGINPPEFILISNNTWVGSTRPCLSVKMKGILEIELEVRTQEHHHRVDYEPLSDLVSLLQCCSSIKTQLNEFIPSITEQEREELRTIAKFEQETSTDEEIEALVTSWTQNSASPSSVKTSEHSIRKVPHCATAHVTIEFVPNLTGQICETIAINEFKRKFEGMNSTNLLSIRILTVNDPWVGDSNSKGFRCCIKAIENIWGETPLLIPRGGNFSEMSRTLENEFQSKVVHLPLAQADDSAHLHNEKIKLVNLLNGQLVFEEVFKIASSIDLNKLNNN